MSISNIALRPLPGSSQSGFPVSTFSVSNVVVKLSTTARGEAGPATLGTTYADNVGADATTVYAGPITLTTTATDAPGGATKGFDYNIALQTPFAYDPTLGNLLLDVNVPAGATVSGGGFGFLTVDDANAIGDGAAPVRNLGSGSATTGTYSTDVPITQFAYAAVPEPAALTPVLLLAPVAGDRTRIEPLPGPARVSPPALDG